MPLLLCATQAHVSRLLSYWSSHAGVKVNMSRLAFVGCVCVRSSPYTVVDSVMYYHGQHRMQGNPPLLRFLKRRQSWFTALPVL